MKKIVLIWMAGLLALALCACSAETAYTVERRGRAYQVDTEASTVSDGKETYRYTFSGNSKAYDLKIEYPDGSSYWWEQRENVGYGGSSEDYDESRYTSGDILRDVLAAKAPRASGGYSGIGALLVSLGLFEAIAPRAAWYWGYGWRFKDVEPSEAALWLGRVGGVLAAAVGIVLLFL